MKATISPLPSGGYRVAIEGEQPWTMPTYESAAGHLFGRRFHRIEGSHNRLESEVWEAR